MAVPTTTTMFPLILVLPNLESYLCWMEFDLTIIANLIQPATLPMQIPSNSVPIEKEKGVPAPTDPHRIILANPNAMKPQDDCSTSSDNLLAMVEDGDEGMEDSPNIDMFLNHENIEDVEMSTDSTKRKRIEEGEEYGDGLPTTGSGVTNASINSYYAREGHCPSKAFTLNAYEPRKFMHLQYRLSLFHKYTQRYVFKLQDKTHAVTFCNRLNNVSNETGVPKLGLGFSKRAL
ncbi:hypothetical protein Cgig2_025246 [Carnegiea gigantea]|uniref:Uncharacterized protein n=1 Tax=Carnegiea gigantea TaxID=171969 RepID=A0A9Q1GWS8_9CARY|nr:hypothetical protein Cgig2_025246 [Carnegiea gigantea]